MSLKTQLASLAKFSPLESLQIIISIISRKISGVSNKYNLIAKTKFDFYQKRNIEVLKNGGINKISFKSTNSGNKITFSIRRQTTDIAIFDEVLLREAYTPIKKICKILAIIPQVIIDAGANIGSSALYFKDCFPSAQILCIEPEESNFKILSTNMSENNLDGVYLLEGGLWNKDEYLNLDNGFRTGEKELSFSLKKIEKDDLALKKIKGYTLSSLMYQYKFNTVDILKIDIEGAESIIFDSLESTKEILSRTKILAIELHDEVIDRFKFTSFLNILEYNHITFGEVTYVYKEPQ